jgi:uroporphyrin-III C-methyltransferase/precorrin-2 dehydrogenase/sirohydrochlorin ferrochelatase
VYGAGASEPYPLGLLLAGRRVLVVGGGAVATRRVPALLAAHARVVLVAPRVTPALRALAEDGRLHWAERGFVPSDVDGAWLVQVAVDDPVVAAEVSAAAEQRRVFCVRADDRTAASAWTPAVTRHGPVTVAVLGGGQPRRAMAVRDSIRAHLDSVAAPQIGPALAAPVGLAESVGSAGPVPAPGEPGAGRVVLIGAGPGDPELITVKGRRLLLAADVVVVDRLAPGLLLDELRPDVEVVDASKIPHGQSRAQEEINRILVDRAHAGRLVARLKGGDPYVFGRGGEEVLACVRAGVPVTVVPGVTSAVAVPAAAGIPVTHRGVAHEFVVVSGHVPPGDPTNLVDWSALARLRGTVCVLMGLANLSAIAAVLVAHGRPASTPVAVVRQGTTEQQQVVTGTLGSIAVAVLAAGLRSPAVIVIGDVVATLPTAAHLPHLR